MSLLKQNCAHYRSMLGVKYGMGESISPHRCNVPPLQGEKHKNCPPVNNSFCKSPSTSAYHHHQLRFNGHLIGEAGWAAAPQFLSIMFLPLFSNFAKNVLEPFRIAKLFSPAVLLLITASTTVITVDHAWIIPCWNHLKSYSDQVSPAPKEYNTKQINTHTHKDIKISNVLQPQRTYLHFAWVIDDAKCIVVTRVCVSVCPRPHAYTIARTLGEW